MLLKLMTNGDDVVSQAVVAGDFPESLGEGEVREYGEGDEPDYDAIKELLTGAVDPEVKASDKDAGLAASLHALLPLSRHEASRTGFWHYIAIEVCPEYVDWRWGKYKDFENRFTSRWSRNAIGRLWWWAELTKQPAEEDPYRLTRSVNEQRFQLWTVDIIAASNQALTRELCEAHAGYSEWVVNTKGVQLDKFTDEVWRHVKIRLATVVVDAMSDEEIAELVKNCVMAAKAKDWQTS